MFVIDSMLVTFLSGYTKSTDILINIKRMDKNAPKYKTRLFKIFSHYGHINICRYKRHKQKYTTRILQREQYFTNEHSLKVTIIQLQSDSTKLLCQSLIFMTKRDMHGIFLFRCFIIFD